MTFEGGRADSARTRVEIAYEVLRAISNGSSKPSKIVSRTGTDWKTFNMLIRALAKRGLVARRYHGDRESYRLTFRGASALASYRRVKADLASLRLDYLSYKGLAETRPKKDVRRKAGQPPRARLVADLKTKGMAIISASVLGRSDIRHYFDVVARDPEGQVHVYAIVKDESYDHVLSMYAKQIDTGAVPHVIYSGSTTRSAMELASRYNIELRKL